MNPWNLDRQPPPHFTTPRDSRDSAPSSDDALSPPRLSPIASIASLPSELITTLNTLSNRVGLLAVDVSRIRLEHADQPPPPPQFPPPPHFQNPQFPYFQPPPLTNRPP
ncbi:hypothetical protein CROQUDRAFT_93985 [Cronartium quercuum f. sp. fusiforme G11]|uniref:Uncharacterized protein n=1 Tax=Cronartium quercuum f. sp. fusiforme G11 TaxID=708437 RepID=A0A9P6TAN0_9BASI|nr:hypothetical protein CROQUDRAFT_93985 [Cronartium quercuum f. sp. fusiforme G11]